MDKFKIVTNIQSNKTQEKLPEKHPPNGEDNQRGDEHSDAKRLLRLLLMDSFDEAVERRHARQESRQTTGCVGQHSSL